jgi:pimeloyl-ACP methyl ester carboxylesterase
VRRLWVIAAIAGAVVLPASASHQAGHTRPQGPAKVRFARGFPALVDHEWGFRVGGFGGIRPGAPLRHVPVIFVHGNTVDHADWYPVRDAFKAAGWSDQELWALSYNGLGGNNNALFHGNPERDAEHEEMGWDGELRITNDELNVPDLYDFIRAVRAYTGSSRFSIVSHSLGVTLARETLKVHPELRRDLVAFVGIAGGNHGTSLCPPGSEGVVMSCDEIAAGTPWLDDLNGPDGSDETYAPAEWMTVCDGSGLVDVAYAGPTYAKSPHLKGATNVEFPLTYHNDLRLAPAIIGVYRTFIEAAEKPVLIRTGTTRTRVLAARRRAPPAGALASTGVGGTSVAGAVLLALAAAAVLHLRAVGRIG